MLSLPPISRRIVQVTWGYALVWTATWLAWLWMRSFPGWLAGCVFFVSVPLGILWANDAWERYQAGRLVSCAITATILYLVWWQFVLFAFNAIGWDDACRSMYQVGLGVFFLIGLVWVVWGTEQAASRCERRRAERSQSHESSAVEDWVADSARENRGPRIWNPLDPHAWYYGRRSRKLNQSLTVLVTYSFWFVLVVVLLSQTQGCEELYESPAGGGQQKQLAQTVRIQKVVRKKFVVNPYSGIKFSVPPIDEVKLQLQEVTQHAYAVGYGDGAGAGFAGGTAKGKVRLIRLEYPGGDWDLNFGIGADQNMLIEYGVRTQHKVAEKTESRTVFELKSFPLGKSPPLVFLTGQKNITLSSAETKILHEYVHEKHGMIFASNGGSYHFHNQFLALMNQVAPDVRPVPVPLDDPIHAIPYQIPFLPYVAPHGGKEALGWNKDGRWICYYHPGDISDAWCDDHAGVKPEVWEACYQLGANVIFYAHAEYAKWQQARESEKSK